MPNVSAVQTVIVGNPEDYTLTIAATGTESDVKFCSGNSFLAMQIDDDFTPGNIIFLSSLTGEEGSFYQLTDLDGDLLTITSTAISTAIAGKNAAADGIQIPLDANIFAGVQNLKIVCSVAQASAQQVKLVMAPVLNG
jgi:hypothetical protein